MGEAPLAARRERSGGHGADTLRQASEHGELTVRLASEQRRNLRPGTTIARAGDVVTTDAVLAECARSDDLAEEIAGGKAAEIPSPGGHVGRPLEEHEERVTGPAFTDHLGLIETRHAVGGISEEAVKESFVIAVEVALALGDISRAPCPRRRAPAGDLARVSAGSLLTLPRSTGGPPRGNGRGHRLFRRGVALFRELGFPFYLAVTLLE